MYIPETEREIIKTAQELVEVCTVSAGNRGSAYQQYSQFIETGRTAGGLSLANMLYAHVDRLSSYLFCPTDARFTIDFENLYPKPILQQAESAARVLTSTFGRQSLDLTFATGVHQSLSYGASVVKLTGKTTEFERDGRKFTHLKDIGARIVPPWLMGVENEGRNGLSEQEAISETVYLSKYDVWRRICYLPDAEKLFKRIMSHSNKGTGPSMPSSYIQVLSTAALNISPQGSNPPSPGGIVQMSGDPNYSTMGPQVLASQVAMHELWVWDDVRQDYLMIQYIEPDILLSPRYKRVNEFCPGCTPYILIQPNEVPGYFWGRSEIVDLTALQGALSETMDDFRRLIGVQYDKRLAFTGFNGDPQELYDDFRSQGWINGTQGAKVEDLTPDLPQGALEYIRLIQQMMNEVSGFGNILSGQGEAGVRAGNHANTLLKTASPRLRDRSLVVERQYGALGDRVLSYMAAKDARQYYVDPEKKDETAFLLADIPEDRRVTVDSHSSSPIYENDHANLIAFALKSGLIDGARAIKGLNIPDKDEVIREWRDRQAAEAKFIAEHPELLTKKGKR